jgi:uncharacterized peroxidase-related enzyme
MSEPVHSFIATIPTWSPYIAPVELAKATPEQLRALKITPSNTGASPYVLTLAHDPESLEVRSPLFNLIMYGKDGLSPAERELGALSTSIVNRCIYCAAVHASRFIGLTKRSDIVENIFANERNAELEARQQALFNFATKLSTTPIEADAKDASGLANAGLSELEQFDLVLSAAIFGWANRLMHTLGEPLARSE